MTQRISSLEIDQNNKKVLDFLYEEALVREVILKTELYGIVWSMVRPGEYYAYERDIASCTDPFRPTILWEYRLAQTVMNTQNIYNLQIYRNGIPYTNYNTMTINVVDELYDVVERMTLNPNKKHIKALRSIQQIIDVREFLLGPPFTLRPNDDLTSNVISAPGTGWKRVPAMGNKWEKIRTPVDANDGDGSYIYDDSNTTQEFGFDILPDGAPQTYSSVTLRACVKNITAPTTIEATLVVEAPGFTPRARNFSGNATNGSYAIIEATWTPATAFDRMEINFMKVRLEAEIGINRITAMELVVNT